MPVWAPVGDLANSLTQGRCRAYFKCWRKRNIGCLLYVAMTRAADRLMVCGYRGVRAE